MGRGGENGTCKGRKTRKGLTALRIMGCASWMGACSDGGEEGGDEAWDVALGCPKLRHLLCILQSGGAQWRF